MFYSEYEYYVIFNSIVLKNNNQYYENIKNEQNILQVFECFYFTFCKMFSVSSGFQLNAFDTSLAFCLLSAILEPNCIALFLRLATLLSPIE